MGHKNTDALSVPCSTSSVRCSRRSFLTVAGTSLVASPSLAELSAEGNPEGFDSHRLEFEGAERWAGAASVHVPRHLDPAKKWPVAVLLHGYAQGSSVERAIDAWEVEYGVLDAYQQLRRPQLLQASTSGRVDRAEQIVEGLSRDPFRGVILVCPVVPIPYFQDQLSQTYSAYADFLTGTLLPRVAELAPACTQPDSVGLGGFSMGGLVGHRTWQPAGDSPRPWS
jgi:hypothetical protein